MVRNCGAELANVKLAKQKTHLKFNLQCKELDVMPASLNITCPIKTQRAKAIIIQPRQGY